MFPPDIIFLFQLILSAALTHITLEKNIQNNLIQEIKSAQLGEMVMDALKKLDEVAYVRFASVYRQFKDINTFMEELNTLIREK